VLNFLKSLSGAHVSQPVLFDHWRWWSRWSLVVQEEVPPVSLSFNYFFSKFSTSTKLSFSLVKYFSWSQPPHFDTAFIGNSVLAYVTNLSATYDVTSGMHYSIQEYFLINTTNITQHILKITSCSTKDNTIHMLCSPSTETLWFLYITPGLTKPPWCFSPRFWQQTAIISPPTVSTNWFVQWKNTTFPMRYKLHLYIHNVYSF
jgi:hypothetical protein